jgi:5'-3' exonuclease
MTKKYLLIDGSYFIFYRVFALQMWWKNAKPKDELINPYTNDTFKEKYIETFLLKINEIKKKLDMNDATVIIGVDCPQSQIWRKSFYPEYKNGRNQEKNKEANISDFFKLTYKHELFIKAGADHMVKLDKLEADDCLALTAKYLCDKYEDAAITIITSDHDYIQLSCDKIQLINLKFNSLLDSKAYSGDPKRDLFYKIILGDKSDNIDGIFNKCGKKTAEKYYDNEELFLDKLKTEDKLEKYERNRRLVDFNEIPDTLVESFINSIKMILL